MFLRLLHPSHPMTSVQKVLKEPSREPLRLGLNEGGVANYSDVGPVKGYVSEMVQYTASDTIND